MDKPLTCSAPGLLFGSSAAAVTLVAPAGRLSLRARGELAPFGSALGTDLPRRIGTRATAGGTEVICLGPDEWTVVTGDAAAITAACATIHGTHPHSLTDISGREVTLRIEGPRAAELLTLGIARDIDGIPVGEGRRTLCDGVTVVLWRDAPDMFRMDIWRSFAPHLLHLFQTGCAELAAETA